MEIKELEIAGLIFSGMLLILAVLHLIVVIGVSDERQTLVGEMAQEREAYHAQGREVPPDLWVDPDYLIEGKDISRSPMAGFLLWAAGLAGVLKGSFRFRWYYVFFIAAAVIIIFLLSFFCVSNCETQSGLMALWDHFNFWRQGNSLAVTPDLIEGG